MKGKKIIKIVIGVFIVIVVLCIIFWPQMEQIAKEQEEKEAQELKENEAKNLGISVDELSDVNEAFAEIGIDDPNLEKSDQGVQTEYKDYIFTATFKDDKVNQISSGDVVFYQDNEAKFKADDKIVTSEQKITLSVQVEQDVKNRLKSPSSAKFQDYHDYEYIRSGDSFAVKGYVDADNSFGANIRTYFVATYDWDGNKDSSLSLSDLQVFDN